MRHMTVLGLIVGLAAVPSVQAQQVGAPQSAQQPMSRMTPAHVPAGEVDLAPVQVRTAPVEREAASSNVVREVSARTILAIIGAVVVVGALISLLA